VTAAPWIMAPVTLKGGWDTLWDMLVTLLGILWGHVKTDLSNYFTHGRGWGRVWFWLEPTGICMWYQQVKQGGPDRAWL